MAPTKATLRRRRLWAGTLLGLGMVLAACSLNPQPLPPADVVVADGGKFGDPTTTPGPKASDDGGVAADASAPPPADAGGNATADAAPADAGTDALDALDASSDATSDAPSDSGDGGG